MIHAELDKANGLLHVRPSAPLEEADFRRLAELVDPFIEQNGRLPGLLLQVDHFPGWKNLAGMVQHFRFVRNHHTKISKVAIVTDAALGELAEKVGSHFVAATVRHFSAGQDAEAKEWITGTAEMRS